MELEFFVLGPLEVRSAGVEIPVRSGQQRVLLAALLLRANQVVPLDELTDRLWGEAPPRGARNTLRAYVMRLRRTLGADDGDGVVVETHPEGYRIRVEPAELDLLRFEDLLAQAGRLAAAGPTEEAQVLRQAVALWRGPVLSNVDSDALHRDVALALSERRLQAVQRRIDLELQLGGDDEIVPELKALTAEHPTRERFCAQLMIALYRSGRQADALEAYRRTREMLDAELGVDPGQDLQELHQSVLTADPALEPARTPRAKVADSRTAPSPDLGSSGSAVTVFEPTPQPAEGSSADLAQQQHPQPVKPPRQPPESRRQRLLGPLSAAWLLATILAIFGGVFDSHPVFYLSLSLMAAVLLAAAGIALAERRRRGIPLVRIRLANAATMLPLLAVGGLLAEVTVNYLGVPAMWGVPLFASALFVHSTVAELAREGRAPARHGMALSSVGAIASGLLIGSLLLFAERGPESSWTTGASVEGASATGKISRAAHGEIQLTGEVVDDKANYLGARLYVEAHRPDGSAESWDTYNGNSKGSAEPISGNRGADTDGLIFPAETTSIRVRACASNADGTHEQLVDITCGPPIEIWRR